MEIKVNLLFDTEPFQSLFKFQIYVCLKYPRKDIIQFDKYIWSIGTKLKVKETDVK